MTTSLFKWNRKEKAMNSDISTTSINANAIDQTLCPTTPQSPICIILVTLLCTLLTTFLLCFAVMTNFWEITLWEKAHLEHITNNTTNVLHWYLDDKVARLSTRNGRSIFLVPMHGGIWTLCIDLNDSEMRYLGQYGFPHTNKCTSYFNEISVNMPEEGYQSSYRDFHLARRPAMRIQNLSISCALVCLIILASASLLGAFGIFQRQISAILVTGVMYLLAALFALFTLMIVRFKRHQKLPTTHLDFDNVIEGLVAAKEDARIAQQLLNARFFATSWSFDLALAGVVLCGATYVLWIMLSKILRYSTLSALLI